MKLSPGSRWKSVVCNTEVVVVRPPATEVALECGGAPMVDIKDAQPSGGAPAPDLAGGSVLGKRYTDEEQGLEVLCTKPGKGSLSLDGRALAIKEATLLPSTD